MFDGTRLREGELLSMAYKNTQRLRSICIQHGRVVVDTTYQKGHNRPQYTETTSGVPLDLLPSGVPAAEFTERMTPSVPVGENGFCVVGRQTQPLETFVT